VAVPRVRVASDRRVARCWLLMRSNLALLACCHHLYVADSFTPVLKAPVALSFDAARPGRIQDILRLKCTKFDFGWGSAPYPAMGAHNAPQTGFKGTYF